MKQSEIRQAVTEFLKEIDVRTISMGDDGGNTFYGSSSVTSREGEIMQCRALTLDGDEIEFDILAHGLEFELVGKAAGAF